MAIVMQALSSFGAPTHVAENPAGGWCGYNGCGVAVNYKFFPPTSNKGYLTWSCADNAGNYAITCINASFDQATVMTLQDPGVAAANFTTDLGAVSAGTGSSSPGSLTGVTDTLQFVRNGTTYYIPLYAVNT